MKQQTIEILTTYNEQDAIELGALMPHLSETFSGEQIAEELLRAIIESPYHAQLVARDASGAIIGAATLSITFGAGAGAKAYLEDFVVNPEIRGGGIGSQLWDAMCEWAREHGAHKLTFTSSDRHASAHGFYLKRGAEIRDTNYFTKPL